MTGFGARRDDDLVDSRKDDMDSINIDLHKESENVKNSSE